MTLGHTTLGCEPPEPTGGSLERLVGDVEHFETAHWGRRTQHYSHGPRAFADVWSISALDDFLANTPRRPLVRLVKNGDPVSPDLYTQRVRLGGHEVADAIDPSKVASLFDGGATIVTQSLHRTCTSVRRFVADLATEVSHPVQANSYLTPADSTGLAAHSDRHDVFVVQVAGCKRWSIADHDEMTLVDGDVLYIPAGVEHQAHGTDTASLHLTIGLIPTSYRSVVERALRSEAPELDMPLPLRYAHDPTPFAPALADHIAATMRTLGDVDLDDVEQRERTRWRTGPRNDVSVARSVDLLAIDVDHRVRRSCTWTISRTDEHVIVAAGTQTLRAPRVCEPAVRQIDEGAPVKVGDLLGLDQHGCAILARRLVAANLCDTA